jgi:hypothetical protein
MPNLDEIGGWITEQLPALVARYKVPGAAIGVYRGGEVFDFAVGVLSRATTVEATADSVFQVGSITKTWTASLIMQLADEGLLDVDQPVVAYLPDFDLADSAAAKAMTVRQLLSHTAGFEGDIFTDTGTNDDAVEKYVATLTTDSQLFAPGEMFSYNNAGFVVLAGKAALANAQLAYQAYEEVFSSGRWRALEARGASTQRPLWASTGVKNQDYPDTLYVSDLIAPDTVNTMPEKTLKSYADHGRPGKPVQRTYDEAAQAMKAVADAGVDLDDVFEVLEHEGIAKFADSWDELTESVRSELEGKK